MRKKRKLLVICGPTATGKTALAIKLAKQFNGELVSADSRQVYRGMDIGTGKDLRESSKYKVVSIKDGKEIGYWETLDEIKIWLLDIVNPDYQFTVADYVKCARLVIEDILKRGKLPILVGGTGFYIKGVVDGIETLGVAPDWELREKLSNLEIEKLREILEKTCPKRWRMMNESDKNNPRRLIRAIEIAQSRSTSEVEGTPPEARGDTSEVKGGNVLFIGLTAPYNILYQRTDQRVEERVKQGVEKEIERLLKMGYSWDNSVLGTTIGYREWRDYMEHETCPPARTSSRRSRAGNIEQKREVIQRWKFDEHSYARRQMTWFKKDKRIKWFDIADQG